MKSDHLQWLIPLAIALVAALFFIDRSLIEDGEVRVSLLEMRVGKLEEEMESYKTRISVRPLRVVDAQEQ